MKESVGIPVAVKVSPFFTAMAHMGKQLDASGASSLVLFNCFYQPDFDIESLNVISSLTLSRSEELLLRLHWVAILFGKSARRSGRYRRRTHCARRSEVNCCRRQCRHDGVGPASEWNSTHRFGPPRNDALDGRARVRIDSANARKHEPSIRARPRGI